MAVGDLTGDGRPDIVIADKGQNAVMVYRNTSTASGAACFTPPPPPTSASAPSATTAAASAASTAGPTDLHEPRHDAVQRRDAG